MLDPNLLHFTAIYFCIQLAGYGFAFYMPSMVSALMNMKIGLAVGSIASIPWICAVIAATFYPAYAVRHGYRHSMGFIAMLSIAIGLCAAGNLPPVYAMVALCFVAMGIICVQPIFWTFPSGYFGGLAAAGSLAVINSIGNLGGFVAPNIKVMAEAHFGANAGLYTLASAPFIAAVLFLFLRKDAVAQPAAAPALAGDD